MLKNVTSISGPVYHSHLSLKASLAPSIGPREFKDSLAKFVPSISIVTARHADQQLGRTVTSFMPLNVEPAQIMVSVDVKSRLIDLIGLSSKFSISFLSDGQNSVADAFAGDGNQNDCFSVASWDYWPSGNPKLSDGLLSFDCELVGSLDIGNHMLFVGVVTEADVAHVGAPLSQ